MNEKILIFGNGQIGNFYKNYFTSKDIEANIAQCDITVLEEVEKAIASYHPTVVINTAGKTNLEWCSQNRLETFNVNVLGLDNIAKTCDKNNIYFIHISSGCIFESKDENDVKKEEDAPNPSAYYAWTKVWGENIIPFEKSDSFKYVILRPRQPVSAQINHKNMLVKMLTFTKFVDTPNAGTVLEDLMEWTEKIIQKKATGIFHVANVGWTTPYEIGLLLKKYVLPEMDIEKITKQELDKMTPNRRVDTVLDISKLKSLGIEVSDYKKRLEEIIKNLGKNISSTDKEKVKDELEKTINQSKQRTTTNEFWKNLL